MVGGREWGRGLGVQERHPHPDLVHVSHDLDFYVYSPCQNPNTQPLEGVGEPGFYSPVTKVESKNLRETRETVNLSLGG